MEGPPPQLHQHPGHYQAVGVDVAAILATQTPIARDAAAAAGASLLDESRLAAYIGHFWVKHELDDLVDAVRREACPTQSLHVQPPHVPPHLHPAGGLEDDRAPSSYLRSSSRHSSSHDTGRVSPPTPPARGASRSTRGRRSVTPPRLGQQGFIPASGGTAATARRRRDRDRRGRRRRRSPSTSSSPSLSALSSTESSSSSYDRRRRRDRKDKRDRRRAHKRRRRSSSSLSGESGTGGRRRRRKRDDDPRAGYRKRRRSVSWERAGVRERMQQPYAYGGYPGAVGPPGVYPQGLLPHGLYAPGAAAGYATQTQTIVTHQMGHGALAPGLHPYAQLAHAAAPQRLRAPPYTTAPRIAMAQGGGGGGVPPSGSMQAPAQASYSIVELPDD